MSGMDPLLALALGHKWLALIALLVGLLIRVFKDDTKVPGVIPKPARPWIAFLLGLALGVIERRTSGAPWKDSLISGVVVGLLPIAGHWLGIEKLRDGKELDLPGLMVEKKDANSKDNDKKGPPTAPPLTVVSFFFIFLLSTLAGCAGCGSVLRTPRDVARGGVLLLVRAADEGDQYCASLAAKAKGSGDVVKLEKAITLAKTCAAAKLRILDAADAGASALLVWDAAAEKNLACAAQRGLAALGDLRVAIVQAGGTSPALLDDGLVMAERLGKGVSGECPASSASSSASTSSSSPVAPSASTSGSK